MLETVYKHNRIMTKHVHTINKCNGKLTNKRKTVRSDGRKINSMFYARNII